MRNHIFLYLVLILVACKNKAVYTRPVISSITESIYASGILKSKSQYQSFANVSGSISQIYLKEGDKVKVGTPILSITHDLQLLNTQNAAISAQYASLGNNQDKIEDAQNTIMILGRKMKNDSLLWIRQQDVYKNGGGTKVELEQRELSFASSRVDYQSAVLKYQDLKKQLRFNAQQSAKNLQISQKLAGDFTLKSELEGVLYQLYKKTGESVTPQTPLALLGNNRQFVLEMQVDEYDIFKVRIGQMVLVRMDSYKGQIFEAYVSSISPVMDEAAKTFLVEAVFMHPPKVLYPFITFEANIVIRKKDSALLIPVSFLVSDSTVLSKNGKILRVKTGLRDYKMVEIIRGISRSDEISIPSP